MDNSGLREVYLKRCHKLDMWDLYFTTGKARRAEKVDYTDLEIYEKRTHLLVTT